MFDLQRFADEAPKAPIPQELAGISENVARDIMAKATQPAPENNSANPVDANDPENVKVSYTRFKETLDQRNELERELAAYRERFGNLNAQPQQAPQQGYQQPPPAQDYQQAPPQGYTQAPPQQQPPAPPIQTVTEDMIKNFEEAINYGAKQLSGFSDEQVDELNYLDDEDPRLKQWEFAKKIAESAVYSNYIATQVAQQQEMQRRAYMQNQFVAAFNDYVARQQAADNFAAVQEFAAKDFYDSQNKLDQLTISEARARINNNMASPADFMVVRDFFSRAKAAYDSRQTPRYGQATVTQPQQPQQTQFPRTDKVNGISGGGGGVTNASLAEMIKTVPWSQIPQEYKQLLLQ